MATGASSSSVATEMPGLVSAVGEGAGPSSISSPRLDQWDFPEVPAEGGQLGELNPVMGPIADALWFPLDLSYPLLSLGAWGFQEEGRASTFILETSRLEQPGSFSLGPGLLSFSLGLEGKSGLWLYPIRRPGSNTSGSVTSCLYYISCKKRKALLDCSLVSGPLSHWRLFHGEQGVGPPHVCGPVFRRAWLSSCLNE